MADDLAPVSLSVKIDLGALVVRTGTGGIKPLSDRDKREISVTARKTLAADRYPEATFSTTNFDPAADGTGGIIDGMLTLAGKSRPERLTVLQPSPGHYTATTTVRQTDFGLKPYSAFLGSLKVADAVEVEIELDLSVNSDQEPGA